MALPRISRGYFAGVILRVSQPGWGRTTQSLYALKLRATIIGYVSPLVVYGSLKPLLGKTYLLNSGAHLSSPCLLAFGFIFDNDCSVYASWPRVDINRESFFFLMSHCGVGCGSAPFSSVSKTSTFHFSSSFGRGA